VTHGNLLDSQHGLRLEVEQLRNSFPSSKNIGTGIAVQPKRKRPDNPLAVQQNADARPCPTNTKGAEARMPPVLFVATNESMETSGKHGFCK
jgi:hypothetical protein